MKIYSIFLFVICLFTKDLTANFLKDKLTFHNICLTMGITVTISVFIYNQILYFKNVKSEDEINWPDAWKLHDLYEQKTGRALKLALIFFSISCVGIIYE